MTTPSAAAFHLAIAAGDTAAVRSMLDSDLALLTSPGPHGASAALGALYAGHLMLADELAARSSPLSIFEAAAFDDTARLTELIAADRAQIESFSPDGWQPLHLAARFAGAQAARALLDADAAADRRSENAAGMRPLHLACEAGHTELVWILIASEADITTPCADGRTPLALAKASRVPGALEALRAAGAEDS